MDKPLNPQPLAPKVYETDSSREYSKAQWWRKHKLGMSVPQLAEATGYTAEAIYLFERGTTAAGKRIKPWVWQRYRMACAGVAAEQEGSKFEW